MAGFDVAVWCEQHRELYAGHLPCAKCQKDREQAARDAALRRGVERLREELVKRQQSAEKHFNGDGCVSATAYATYGICTFALDELDALLRAGEEDK